MEGSNKANRRNRAHIPEVTEVRPLDYRDFIRPRRRKPNPSVFTAQEAVEILGEVRGRNEEEQMRVIKAIHDRDPQRRKTLATQSPKSIITGLVQMVNREMAEKNDEVIKAVKERLF